MTKSRGFRVRLFVLGLLGLTLLLIWVAVFHKKPEQPKSSPPTPVRVAQVSARDVPLYLTSLGTAAAWRSVLINPLVGGRLIYVAKEGQYVRPGDRLAAIDCGSYDAALLQSKGTLAKDSALLAGAQRNLHRYAVLNSQDSISRQQFEDQMAVVKQDQGVVMADQGVVAAAQFNVNSCTMTSPVVGRVGVRLVDAGNVVTTGLATGIVSVNQVEPIAVTFSVPQAGFLQLAQASDNFRRPLETEAYDQSSGAFLGAGALEVADNHVDQNTGTVALKARFTNAGQQLWPGEFVNVRMTVAKLAHVLTIPVAAVNEGPNGPYAFVVTPNFTVRQQPIQVAARQAGLAVISTGLDLGERVVIDGQMSLRPGGKVAVAPARAAAGGVGR